MLCTSHFSTMFCCLKAIYRATYNYYTYVKVKRADKVRKVGDEARVGVPGSWKQELIMFPEKVQRYTGIFSLDPITGLWRETWIHQ
jgi:hypothetical protein